MSVKEDLKRNIIYPEVISAPKKKSNKNYLISKALLHLRKHFTNKELARLLHKSKKYIYRKLKDLR